MIHRCLLPLLLLSLLSLLFLESHATQPMQLVVVILANEEANDVFALHRLLVSVHGAAEVLHTTLQSTQIHTDLHVHFDCGASAEKVRQARTFPWPHGNKSIHRRWICAGQTTLWMEAWEPSTEEVVEVAVLTEDHSVFAREALLYVVQTLTGLTLDVEAPLGGSARLAGISLTGPGLSFNTHQGVRVNPPTPETSESWKAHGIHLHQTTPLCGAYLARSWRLLRRAIESQDMRKSWGMLADSWGHDDPWATKWHTRFPWQVPLLRALVEGGWFILAPPTGRIGFPVGIGTVSQADQWWRASLPLDMWQEHETTERTLPPARDLRAVLTWDAHVRDRYELLAWVRRHQPWGRPTTDFRYHKELWPSSRVKYLPQEVAPRCVLEHVALGHNGTVLLFAPSPPNTIPVFRPIHHTFMAEGVPEVHTVWAGSDGKDALAHCDRVVEEPAVLFGLYLFPQHYHTLADGVMALFQTLYEDGWEEKGTDGGANVHFIISNVGETRFSAPIEDEKSLGHYADLFLALTQKPLRFAAHDLANHTTCFRHLSVGLSDRSSFYRATNEDPQGLALFSAFLFSHLHLTMSASFETHPILILLARRATTEARRILNSFELLERARTRWAMDAREVVLEDRTLRDQVALMRRTAILLGVDGTGLLNAMFMQQGCVVIHVMPYGMAGHKGDNFRRVAERGPGYHLEYAVPRTSARFYYAENAGFASLLEGGEREIARFWEHEPHRARHLFGSQDVIIPLEDFDALIRHALTLYRGGETNVL